MQLANFNCCSVFILTLSKVETFSKEIAGDVRWHITTRFAPTSAGAYGVAAVRAWRI